MPLLLTKTPHLNSYLAAVAKANDQLCFFMFLDAEAGPTLISKAASRMSDYTPAAFPGNPYAPRLNVRLEHLSEFRETQRNQALGVALAFSTEQLLLYVESTMVFFHEANRVKIKVAQPIDEYLSDFYRDHISDPLNSAVIQTIKYLRLRRNHFIHQADELSAEFKKLQRYDSPKLQQYWSGRTTITPLLFSKNAFTISSFEEGVSYIKIIRLCMETIDQSIVQYVHADALIKDLRSQFQDRNHALKSNKPRAVQRLIRKVKKSSEEIYGIKGSDEEIAAVLGVAL